MPLAHGWRCALLVAAFALGGCDDPSDERLRLRRLTDLPGDDVGPIFSPDGTSIAFTHGATGARDVFVHHLASGETSAFAASGADEHDPSWSPDGSRLVHTAGEADGAQAIWLAPVVGAPARRLSPPDVRAYRARWSPAGDLVAFTVLDPRRRVWISRPDGAPRPLTDETTDHIAYGWSPGGDSVLTVSFGEAAQDLWTWPVDGSTPRRLTTRIGEEWWPTWSPRGDRVAFYTTWDDEMTDVWVVEVGTGALERITDLPVEDFRPAWSPDGAWLAFSSDRVSKSGLWIQPAHADGVALPIATDGRAGGTPAWSPDGGSIAFSYLRSRSRLFRVSRLGGEPRALTGDALNVFEAVASPDGRRVAFETDGAGSEADLAVLDLENGEIVRLTEETTYNARPAWSPDGATLAFERSPGGGPRTLDLAILPATGGEPRLLTGTGYVRGPVWCGSEIVYTVEHSATASGPDQLWAVPVETGEPRQLTFSPVTKRATDCTPGGDLLYHAVVDGRSSVRSARLSGGGLSEPRDHGPGVGARWSPDGTEIALLSDRDGQWDLYVVSTGDGTATRVTDSPLRESWPDWIPGSDDLVFSANPGDRDIWLAELARLD